MTACPKMAPRIESPKHLSFLHQLVCVICGAPEVHVHHLRRGRTRRGQYRAGDNEGAPLCPCHHNIGDQSLHGQERFGVTELEYFQANGIHDPYGLVDDLFANTGNYETCMAIIANAKSSVSETAPIQERSSAPSDAAPSDARRISAVPKSPPVGE